MFPRCRHCDRPLTDIERAYLESPTVRPSYRAGLCMTCDSRAWYGRSCAREGCGIGGDDISTVKCGAPVLVLHP